MRTLSSTDPQAFLSGIASAGQVLAAYTGIVQVYRYTGPHTFYRAAGLKANGQLAGAYGGHWWADESALIAISQKLSTASYWMTPAETKTAWASQYQALTALCGDWNDMSEMYVLELPPGETIEGLAGPAKEQPEFSAYDPGGRHNPDKTLVGGAEQVFIKAKNPFWVTRINIW